MSDMNDNYAINGVVDEYDKAFIGEVEVRHFEESRGALSCQRVRFDEPKLLEMSPVLIKQFLIKNNFDLSVDGAVIIKSFDFMGSWSDYFMDLGEWLLDCQIPQDEPSHPEITCYSTKYFRELI